MHGVLAEMQGLRDLLVPLAGGHQREDLGLAGGEGARGRGGWRFAPGLAHQIPGAFRLPRSPQPGEGFQGGRRLAEGGLRLAGLQQQGGQVEPGPARLEGRPRTLEVIDRILEGVARRLQPEVRMGDLEAAASLVGKPLPPSTKLWKGEGDLLDVASLRGRKSVLVILRGYDKEVCIYCVTQTASLADFEDQFDERGVDLLVLYPGSAGRLDTFLEAYRKLCQEFKAEGVDELPYPLCFDPGYALVEELDLRASQARPTTLVLDEEGVVRWAYVGETIEDRPDAQRILREIDALGGG